MILDTTYIKNYIDQKQIEIYEHKKSHILKKLEAKDSMLDWYDMETCISCGELSNIEQFSTEIRKKCDLFLVVAIGGSYLGGKAIIDALSSYFSTGKPEILFVGTNLSTEYQRDLMTYIQNRNIILNVISKSGNTLETIQTFEPIYELMKKKYPDRELKERIYITTGEQESYFYNLAKEYKYPLLTIPKEIGGRFSVFTVVGLLPIAVAGFDIHALLKGVKKGKEYLEEAYRYACYRDYFYHHHRLVESFTIYEPKLTNLGEWLKQLFAETQGKEGKGILPILTSNTKDLHSLGQYYQEGSPILFETVIKIKSQDLNDKVSTAVLKAHYEGHTPSIVMILDELNEEAIGIFCYFMEVSATIGAYLLEVNPFDQPGVENYKQKIKEV